MRVIFCAILILAGGAGVAALSLTAENPADLLGLYDARGLGFVASVIVFLLGLLFLLFGGSKKKGRVTDAVSMAETQAGHAGAGEVETPVEDVPEPVANPRRDEAEAEGDRLLAEARKAPDEGKFEQALAAYREALGLTPDSDWSRQSLINSKLGRVHLTIGRKSRSPEDVSASIEAFRTAIGLVPAQEDRTRFLVTLDQLGSAYVLMFHLTADDSYLESGSRAYRECMEWISPESSPSAYARSVQRFGNTLRMLGEERKSVSILREAAAQLGAALDAHAPESDPELWTTSKEQLGVTLEAISNMDTAATDTLTEAIRMMQEAAAYSAEHGLAKIEDRVNRHLERMRDKQDRYSNA